MLCVFRPPKNYKNWPPFSWQTYRALKNVLHRCDRAMIYVFIAGSYFPWLTLENTSHSMLLFCMEWIIWLMAAIGIAYQQVSIHIKSCYRVLSHAHFSSSITSDTNAWRRSFILSWAWARLLLSSLPDTISMA